MKMQRVLEEFYTHVSIEPLSFRSVNDLTVN